MASVVVPFLAFFAFFGFSVFVVVAVSAALGSFLGAAKLAPESPITIIVAIAIFLNFVSPVKSGHLRPAYSSCD